MPCPGKSFSVLVAPFISVTNCGCTALEVSRIFDDVTGNQSETKALHTIYSKMNKVFMEVMYMAQFMANLGANIIKHASTVQ